ncbi:hypothetical protein P8452_30456 [Trifolium repens]|nr:hypothetical protein P8452_30456 [Trifolium repens]
MNNASRYRPKVTKQDPLRSFGQNFLESQDWFINLLSGKLFLGNPLIGQKSKIAYSFGFRHLHSDFQRKSDILTRSLLKLASKRVEENKEHQIL